MCGGEALEAGRSGGGDGVADVVGEALVKVGALAFCIGFAATMVFETTAMVVTIGNERKKRQP